MKLIVAGADVSAAVYAPLMRSGHKVLGYANTTGRLAALVQLERPEGLLIVGEFTATPAALAALLPQLGLPVALIPPPHWDCAPLRAAGVLVLDGGLDLVAAAAALQQQGGPAVASRGGTAVAPLPPVTAPASVPASTAAPAAPALATALTPPVSPPRVVATVPGPATGSIVVLRGVLGGVGVSGLALALGLAAGALGRVLVATLDPLAFAARLGLSPTERDQVRRFETVAAVVLGGAATALPGGYEWAVVDCPPYPAWAGEEQPAAQRVLVTRPTGEGRLAVVRALADWRRRGLPAAHLVLNGPGPLAEAEFTRLVSADLGACPPVTALPWDTQVAALEETQGAALTAPRYGPAVLGLARRLAPALPWPALTPEKATAGATTTAEPGRRWQVRLPRVEVTE